MKTLSNLAATPASVPLVSDDILELHAARLLLLLEFAGIGGRIEGLPKLAKLDFFVRYPAFFARAADQPLANDSSIESRMVRHHYGPWDKRYYHVLAFLESRDLVVISKKGNSYNFSLTTSGKRLAQELSGAGEFDQLVTQMKAVKSKFGGLAGSSLKKLIYEKFDADIAAKPLGTVIGHDL